jgi:hypothetical protein
MLKVKGISGLYKLLEFHNKPSLRGAEEYKVPRKVARGIDFP